MNWAAGAAPGRQRTGGAGPQRACAVCAGITHSRKDRLLTCRDCSIVIHASCLGIGRHGYPGGSFQCADCVLVEARLPARGGSKALELAQELVRVRSSRVGDSSQATYAAALHRFVKFGTTSLGLAPDRVLPATSGAGIPLQWVRLFLVWAHRKYKPATVQLTLSALVDWHKSKELPATSVTDESVKKLQEQLTRQAGAAGQPLPKRGMYRRLLTLCIKLLGDLMRGAGTEEERAIYWRDAAWLLLGFFGLFRRSELIALRLGDVRLVEDGTSRYVSVLVRKSKTDQHGKGVWVHIVAANGGLKIWETVERYLQYRRRQGGVDSDPLLTAWDFGARCLTPARAIASGQTLADRLRSYLVRLKAWNPSLLLSPGSYGMHSLRRGGVVAAWESGVPLELLMVHGRWRSTAIMAYLQATTAHQLTVSAAM